MRKRTLLIGLALLAAACGGTATTTTTAAPGPTAAPAEGSAPTEAPQGTAAPTSSAAPETVEPEGPSAPDFSTTLSNGAEFSLAAHDRPIYLIFWAEW